MEVSLAGHFTCRRLLRFVLSPVLMMVFTSLYGVVDGFFVSNYAGPTGLAAVNLVWPVLMGVGTVGFMVGSGGSAIVSRTLGEGDFPRANRYFSLLIYVTAGAGAVLSGIFFFLIGPISAAMGAGGDLLRDCLAYGRILTFFSPVFILQVTFQSFLVTAGKPDLSFRFSILGGVANMVLDWLFIVPLHWGWRGLPWPQASARPSAASCLWCTSPGKTTASWPWERPDGRGASSSGPAPTASRRWSPTWR